MLWLLLGGINADNCQFFVEKGASHVIVTSYVFRDGQIDFERLEKLKQLIGKEHLVLDLSCRKKAEDNKFYVMTDRWQKFTTTSIECVRWAKYIGWSRSLATNVGFVLQQGSVPPPGGVLRRVPGARGGR